MGQEREVGEGGEGNDGKEIGEALRPRGLSCILNPDTSSPLMVSLIVITTPCMSVQR